jgi:aminopeptidase N
MGALGHELFHSWYGRGVKPRSQNDGWFDEAWTTFASDGFRGGEKKLSEEGKKYRLCTDNPWHRTTSGNSYRPGAAAFHRIALAIGEEKLIGLMAEFFEKYQLKTASTQEMEAYLFEATQNEAVKQIFHRYIYGRDGNWNDVVTSSND